MSRWRGRGRDEVKCELTSRLYSFDCAQLIKRHVSTNSLLSKVLNHSSFQCLSPNQMSLPLPRSEENKLFLSKSSASDVVMSLPASLSDVSSTLLSSPF